MQKILEPILVTIIFVGSYILNYSCFDTCLSDDVEFNYGKHKKRKIPIVRQKRKTEESKNLRLYIFIDITEQIQVI